MKWIFTKIDSKVIILLANLLWSIRILTTLLVSTCHALKESVLVTWGRYCVKNQINSGIACSVILSTMIFIITVVKSCFVTDPLGCAPWIHNILTTAMTNVLKKSRTMPNHCQFVKWLGLNLENWIPLRWLLQIRK